MREATATSPDKASGKRPHRHATMPETSAETHKMDNLFQTIDNTGMAT